MPLASASNTPSKLLTPSILALLPKCEVNRGYRYIEISRVDMKCCAGFSGRVLLIIVE